MHKARSVLSVKEKVGWVAGAWHSFAAPVTERAKRQPGSGKADGSRCRLHSLVLCALLDACKWHKKQRLQSVSHACAKIFLPHVEPPSTLHRQHWEDCVTLSQADQLRSILQNPCSCAQSAISTAPYGWCCQRAYLST